MSMLRFFIAYEWTTQVRSMRFRGLALAYVVAGVANPVAMFFVSRRATMLIGPGAYNAIVLMGQPMLTALLAAGLAVDAIARERDEGSFGVLSVASISSLGYLLRRWIAIVVICGAISLVPTIITAALAIRTMAAAPLILMFAEGWLTNVLPALLASSAIAMALGTITGRTVLAIVFAFFVLIIGLETLNGFLFYAHMRFDGPASMFGGTMFSPSRIEWLIKGYIRDFPSDAAYPLRSDLRAMLARSATGGAFAVMLLATASFYLRRTRRDLRPWTIPEKHQLRTMIRAANRFREEFSPDAAVTIVERAAVGCAIVAVIWIGVYLVRRTREFARLADSRYAAETMPSATATSTDIVTDRADVTADVGRAGDVRSRAQLAIRNAGRGAVARLSFEGNPLMKIERFDASSGRLSYTRNWNRIDVTLDPSLAPGETRRLTLELTGTPANVDFNLQAPGKFAQRWNRYKTAKEAIYLTDLSRSSIDPYATEVRMSMGAADLVPILRYAPWQLGQEWYEDGFVGETWMTSTALHMRLRHRYTTVADSCGALSTATLDSQCKTDLAQYSIIGGPLVERAITPSVALAYIASHAPMARIHAPTFATAVRRAADAWPSLALPPHMTFVERPHRAGENDAYMENYAAFTVRQIGASGAMFIVPEGIFTHAKPINAGIFAAAIMSGTLRGKRPVIAPEAAFFSRFFNSIAMARLGMRKMRAVEPGQGGPPQTEPLLEKYYQDSRTGRVLASIEYRIGSAAFAEGIDEFVNARTGAGTAKEMIATLGRHGGIDLSRTYDDYFAGHALPQLTLVDVQYHRNGNAWRIAGSVKNEGTGEAFVPIALRTSQGTQWQTVRVDTAQIAPFTFTTAADPRQVQLDPEQVCYRYAAIGTIDTVDYRGAS